MIRTHYKDPLIYAQWDESEKDENEGWINWYKSDGTFTDNTLGKKISGIICYWNTLTECWHSVATGGRVE
jgi:hypothetical protein